MGINDFGDFVFDDDEFAKGAGINKLTKTWKAVFGYIRDKAQELADLSQSGATSKEFYSRCAQLNHAIATVNEVLDYQQQVVGPDGKIYNFFGELADDNNSGVNVSGNNEVISEDDLILKLEAIIKGCTSISVLDADSQIELNKSNVEDDGEDHGDLDDVDW